MNVQCLNCAKLFYKRPSKILSSPNHYCCRTCANLHNPRRKLEGFCLICKKSISKSRTYCFNCFLNRPSKAQSLSVSKKHHRLRLKDKAIEYKGAKCSICGYCKCKQALEFHHLDPNQKDFSISAANTKAWSKIQIELDKCILVCANCHREIHENWRSMRDSNSLPSLDRGK